MIRTLGGVTPHTPLKFRPCHFVGSYDDPIKIKKGWETWKKFFFQIADKHVRLSKREEYKKSVLHGLLLKLRI